MNFTSTEILFDKFEILETLKKDTHTSVFLANHIYLGKRIILKTLTTDNLADKTLLDRFKREAKIMAQLEHPNLIKVLDFGIYGNHFYISFEYFDSRNLREVIKNNNLTEQDKIHLLVQLLNALNIAHQTKIIHRDIKPENILVNKDYHLKIADFGLALVQNDNSLTHKSSIVGTPSYMSPEQIRGEELTPQTDLFSSGIVALELFTGTNPFLGSNINDTINRILNFDENAIQPNLALLQPESKEAINSMLKKSRSQRAKSASEVLGYLGVEGTIYKSLPIDTTLTNLQKQKTIRKTYRFIIPLLILIAASAIWFIQSRTSLFDDNFGYPNDPNKDTYKQLIENYDNYVVLDKLPAVDLPEAGVPVASSGIGKLFVDVSPWADVFINNKKIETTPLSDYIELKPGRYNLKLTHPDFPAYTKRIEITSDKIETIKLDFKNMLGSLDCKINPWGDVYIDGELRGTTPLREPILLFPGNYLLTITNPQYGRFEKRIKVTARETINFKYNFDEQNNEQGVQ